MSGPSPIVSVLILSLPTGTWWMRSSGGRPDGEPEQALEADREVEVAAGVEAALGERLDAGDLALAQLQPGLRRRCRSRRRARACSPRPARGRRSWCSGPPSCGRCRPAGRGTWRRSPAPPRGSGTGASGRPPRRAPKGQASGDPTPHARWIRSRACPTSPSTTPEPAHCSRFRRATPRRWGSTPAGRRSTRACTSATPARSSSSASSSASSSTRATGSRSSATSPTSTTRSTTPPSRPAGRPAELAAEMARPTARTPTGSGSAGRTRSRSRPSTSGRSSS